MKTKAALAALTMVASLAAGLWVAGQDRAQPPRSVVVVPPGTGLRTGPGEWKLLGTQSGGALAIVEFTMPAGEPHRGPPLHRHTREDDGWYVIEGKLTFEVDGQTTTVGPGTMVWAPRDIPHRYHVSKAPVRYLMLLCPAGLEDFFRERSELRKRFPLGSPEYEAAVHELQLSYGVPSVVSPPATTPTQP